MADDEHKHFPKGPPESEEDWQKLHLAVYRANRTWIVTGPQVAFVTNWRALVFAISLFAILRRSEVVAFLDMISGASK
jgi:hypothetical protein